MQNFLLPFTLLFLLSLPVTVLAQDTVWLETFGRGLGDWQVSTPQCGDLPGGFAGAYELTQATSGGEPLEGLSVRFSVVTDREFTLRFDDGTNRGFVQGSYRIEADTFKTEFGALNLGPDTTITDTLEDGSSWIINLEASQSFIDDFGGILTGIGNPAIDLSGQLLSLSDANTELLFQRVSSCGDLWLWSFNGDIRRAAIAGGESFRIPSQTADNGAALLNPDFYTTGGSFDGVGNPPFPDYNVQLTSPVIDLSDVPGSLKLDLTQFVFYLNPSVTAPLINGRRRITTFAYSIDGGTTWSDPIDINEGIEANEPAPALRSFPIPPEANQAEQFRLRFTWAADFYFWVLDDIAITTRPAFDMQANTNFFAIAPNAATPISQLEDFFFWGDIQNNGSQTATGVALNLTIDNNTTGNQVYNQTNTYGELVPDSLAENKIFGEPLEADKLETGLYTGTYALSMDSVDANTNNDTIRFNFFVTDTTFSKEFNTDLSGIAAADDASMTYGNVFYLPNGNGYFARYISFDISNPEDLAGESLTILLYEWEGDQNENLAVDPGEYGGAPIAFNNYTIRGDEDGLITIPIDLEETGIPLQDERYYLPMLQFISPDGELRMRFTASGALDYLPTFFLTDSLGMPRYASALEVGQSTNPSFGLVGFGWDIVPRIRLHIGDNPNLSESPITSTNDILSAENRIHLYPNPARDVINLEIDLVEMAERAEVRIFNMSGQLIHQREYDRLRQGRFDYDLGRLPAGPYVLQFITDRGMRTQRFVIDR